MKWYQNNINMKYQILNTPQTHTPKYQIHKHILKFQMINLIYILKTHDPQIPKTPSNNCALN